MGNDTRKGKAMIQDADKLNTLEDAIKNFFKAQVITGTSCTHLLHVSQFTFTLHYLPFYLAMDKLGLGDDAVKYSGKEGDTDVVCHIYQDTARVLFSGKPYRLGLSELPRSVTIKSRSGDDTDTIIGKNEFEHRTFIDRLPLWGIALANNPKIEKIRTVKRLDIGPLWDQYWRLFEGKFSLLSAEDFKGLRISIYKQGSTAYRLFTDYVERVADIIVAEVDYERELDDLFDGVVDVALTVRPWRAVAQAQERGQMVEVVYNHLSAPEAITDIYTLKFDGDPYSDAVSKAVLSGLYALVELQIERLYRDYHLTIGATDTDLISRVYCRVRNNGTKKCSTSGDKDKWCGQCVGSCAGFALLNDSRIYSYVIDSDSKGSGCEKCASCAHDIDVACMEWEANQLRTKNEVDKLFLWWGSAVV
ncbi:MAG TPA: hypothetical protein ENI68_11260 [Gammaproteobacteria bacterium]|nr:hypothetical protein [Gammaproteobacteria bacterium]